jgi:hypothetical protein
MLDATTVDRQSDSCQPAEPPVAFDPVLAGPRPGIRMSSTPRPPPEGFRLFLVMLVAVVAVALVAGAVFSRADPQRAARMLLGDQAVLEPEGETTAAPAPTSGAKLAAPTCGMWTSPVGHQVQIDAIASGIVVVQYREDADRVAVEAAVADRPGAVLVAPNPSLEARVVATAWTRRLELDEVLPSVLQAFVTAHGESGPDPEPCEP